MGRILILLIAIVFVSCEPSNDSERLELVPEPDKDLREEYEKQLAISQSIEKSALDSNILIEYKDVQNKDLEAVKANFRRINSIEEWTSINSLELWETTEGGQANFYYNGQKLEKVVVRQFGETRQRLTEYYLQNEYLSFVFDKWIIYNRPLYWDSLAMKTNNDDQVFDFEKSEITEERSYFANTKLIHKFDNEDCNAPFSEEYLNKEEVRIMAEFEKIADLKKNE